MPDKTKKQDAYEQIPVRPDTKKELTVFKEVAGLTYDEAVRYLLLAVLQPEDDGSVARAGLRVRESAMKDETPGNQTGLPAIAGNPLFASITLTP
jgi:hypothetical protein